MVLAIGVILLLALVNRPAPKTAGIIEPTPLERVRSDYERMRQPRSGRPTHPPRARPKPAADPGTP